MTDTLHTHPKISECNYLDSWPKECPCLNDAEERQYGEDRIFALCHMAQRIPKVFESLSLRERLQTLTGWEIWFQYFFLWNSVWYEDIPNNIILLSILYIYIYIYTYKLYIYIILFDRLGFIIFHIGGFGPPILTCFKRHGGFEINRQNAQWANRIFLCIF